MNFEQKIVIRLIDGPADGLVLIVPAQKIPPSVAFGSAPVAMYERVLGDGELICFRFTAEVSKPS